MKNLMCLLQECCFNEDGAIAAEYVILLSLIAVVAMGGVTLLGGAVYDLFSRCCGSLSKIRSLPACLLTINLRPLKTQEILSYHLFLPIH